MTPDEIYAHEYARLSHEYPDEASLPSCASLFGAYVQCSNVAQQFKSMYRYGQVRRCGEMEWKRWQLCWNREREGRLDGWRQVMARWWTERSLGVSSELVWRRRREQRKDWPRDGKVGEGVVT